MLVFIDESGDTGRKLESGSSRYFVIVLIVFKDHQEAIDCDHQIDLLRQELRLPLTYEFKFNKLRKNIRQIFLQTVASYHFSYYGIVIDKNPNKLFGDGFNVKESFYKYACHLVFSNAKPYLEDAIVVIDGSGSRIFKRELRSYLKKKVGKVVKRVKMQSSHSNNLIQLADMVAGALHRNYSLKGDKDVYRPIIKPREKKVQIWP